MMIGGFNINEQNADAKMAAIIAANPDLFEDRIYVHYDFDEETGEVTLYDTYAEAESGKTYPCGAIGCPERDDDIYADMDDQGEADAKYETDVDCWMQNTFQAVWSADSEALIRFCSDVIYDITH